LITNEHRINGIKKDYAVLKSLLSAEGNASANAAESIYKFLISKKV